MTHQGDKEAGSSDDSLGEKFLGRYRVEKRIGRGGMGEVLLAVDELLHRRVALKRVHAAGSGQADLRSSVLREARRASQINDRRIAAIYDVLELDDEVILVMEYVDGVTLRRRMANRFTLEEFWDLSIQCVEALAVAHRHGVVHRDIKPENLMVTEDHQIKILDFGIAKRTQLDDSITTVTAVQSHFVAGTPQYMAPEAHLGGTIDERTDIFSLGVVFYELLTAKRPFDGTTYAAIADKALNAIPSPVSDLNPDASAELSALVARMLAKNPDDRFASASELMQHMQRVRHANAQPHSTDTTVAVEKPLANATTPSRRRRARVYSLLAAVVVVTGLLMWRLWKSAGEPALPVDRNVAVLAPEIVHADDDFEWFALGASQLLSSRLQQLGDTPGFQLASFQEGYDEKVRSASDARKVLGVRLALVPTLEQGPDFLRARLDLVDTENSKVIRSRAIETALSEPFTFLDRLYHETVVMLGLSARTDSLFTYGIRGAGTLRFHLRGLGRLRAASMKDDSLRAQRAVEEFELASRTEPDAAVVWAPLSSAQLETYRFTKNPTWLQRAAISARQAVGLDDTRFEAHRSLGSVLATERKYPESLIALARAADLAPADGDLLYVLGRAHFRIGQPEKEKDVYLAAIARRPHCWQPHWWYAAWCYRQGRVPEAINAFEAMIHRAPLLHRGYSSLGGILVLQGNYPRAIELLRRSTELCPTSAGFANLGNAYFNSRKFVEAIGAYNQSFQFGLAGYETWLNLGDAYFWLRDREDQAAEAYAQAVRLGNEARLRRRREGQSDDPMIPANLASVFPKLGLPDSARVYLDMVLKSNSTNPMAQYCVALTYWQLHERENALQAMEKSVRAGYPIAWLRDSPIFDEWRELEAFQALLGAASPEPQVTGSRN